MQKLRKYAPYVLIVALLAFVGLSQAPSCKRAENQRVVPAKKENSYEPKFRKDGDLWLIKAETGDTLMKMDVEYANTPNRIEYGMMYRKSMDETMSMLFFYGQHADAQLLDEEHVCEPRHHLH